MYFKFYRKPRLRMKIKKHQFCCKIDSRIESKPAFSHLSSITPKLRCDFPFCSRSCLPSHIYSIPHKLLCRLLKSNKNVILYGYLINVFLNPLLHFSTTIQGCQLVHMQIQSKSATGFPSKAQQLRGNYKSFLASRRASPIWFSKKFESTAIFSARSVKFPRCTSRLLLEERSRLLFHRVRPEES